MSTENKTPELVADKKSVKKPVSKMNYTELKSKAVELGIPTDGIKLDELKKLIQIKIGTIPAPATKKSPSKKPVTKKTVRVDYKKSEKPSTEKPKRSVTVKQGRESKWEHMSGMIRGLLKDGVELRTACERAAKKYNTHINYAYRAGQFARGDIKGPRG